MANEQIRFTASAGLASRIRRYATDNSIDVPESLRSLITRALDIENFDAYRRAATAALLRQQDSVEALAVEILTRTAMLQTKIGAFDAEQDRLNRAAINEFLKTLRSAPRLDDSTAAREV